MHRIFHLIQFADSAFPVGAFSFSNGLETAAHLGAVHDAASLESYVRAALSQAAFTDGVGALMAWRAVKNNDLQALIKADQAIMLFRLNDEARLMLARMGKKLAELGLRLFGSESIFGAWLEVIDQKLSPGSYPAAQGIAFALADLSEKELYAAHQYGVINMILSAALRCVRVSHYETQQILFNLARKIEEDWEKAKVMSLENMNSFTPLMDIFASLHEKGKMRMFMN